MPNRMKSLIVLAYQLVTFLLCALIFLFFLGMKNVFLVNFSRTFVIVMFSFSVSYLMLTRIYGGMEIGTRKSKSIVFSMFMVLLFTDLIAHFFLCIMDYSIVNNYHFVYEYPLTLFFVFVVQMLLSMGLAFLGNEIFFAIFKPQKCVLIYNPYEEEEKDAFIEKVHKFRKQYRISKVIPYEKYSLDSIYNAVDSCDAVFIYGLCAAERAGIVNYCFREKKDIYYDIDMSDIVASGGNMISFEDTPVIFSPVKNNNMAYRIIKRLADIFLSLVGLILLIPLFLGVAIAIKSEDHGPIFYRQERVTIAGRVFKVIKFRSMKEASGDIHESMTVGDSRVTKVGGFIRKFRIDELPQLINVLLGDMSLVGPRPEMIENVEKYTQELPEFTYRHRMKAGITGMAQVYGKYNTPPKDKLVYDLMYIENFSIWLDIKIILRTVLVLFTPDESTEAFKK